LLTWSQAAASAAAGTAGGDADDDDDEDYSAMDTSGGFFVDTIVAKGLPEGPGVPSEVSNFKCRCDSCAHTILHDDCVSTVGCCHWS
jgi:hypothetical protein